MCNVSTGLALLVFIISQVSSTGVFKLQLVRFTNDHGLLDDRTCCAGPQIDNVCTEKCNTYFRICIKHFQREIDRSTDCAFGEFTTEVIGNNSFTFPTESKDSYTNPLEFNIDFAWPGDFSLIIEALHESRTSASDVKSIATFQGSSKGPIAPLDGWISEQWNSSNLESLQSIHFNYKIECHDRFYGNSCTVHCSPRDDDLGHYECGTNGQRVCKQGWQGTFCTKAICLEGCHSVHGECSVPDECRCKLGWEGPHCDTCVRYPNCQHGYCDSPFQCICQEGWGGLFCNQDLNYCTTHSPCINGGTCTNTGEGAYTCSCPLGFTGANCETEVDNCQIQPCENGGECKDVGNDFVCECLPGFAGPQCQDEVERCQENPCGNGGNCHPIGASYRCHCAPGWNGVNCLQEVNECMTEPEPCLNGATCIDELNNYTCNCAPGFTGRHCEINDDECAGGNPCLNGGECQNGNDQFKCICRPGFNGDLCENDFNECMLTPCANGGTCVDKANDFKCHCAPGFTGRMCGSQINECGTNPCANRGSCIDLVNGYICQCRPQYEGLQCQYEFGKGPPTTTTQSTTELETHQRTSTSSEPSAGGLKTGASKTSGGKDAINKEVQLTQPQLILIVCLGSGIPMCLLLIFVTILLYRRCKRKVDDKSEEKRQNEINGMNNRIHNAVETNANRTRGKGDDFDYPTAEKKIINELEVPATPQVDKNSASAFPSKVVSKEMIKDINTETERQLLNGRHQQPLTRSLEQYLQYCKPQGRYCTDIASPEAISPSLNRDDSSHVTSDTVGSKPSHNTNNSNNSSNINSISSTVCNSVLSTAERYPSRDAVSPSALADINSYPQISIQQYQPTFRHSELPNETQRQHSSHRYSQYQTSTAAVSVPSQDRHSLTEPSLGYSGGPYPTPVIQSNGTGSRSSSKYNATTV